MKTSTALLLAAAAAGVFLVWKMTQNRPLSPTGAPSLTSATPGTSARAQLEAAAVAAGVQAIGNIAQYFTIGQGGAAPDRGSISI